MVAECRPSGGEVSAGCRPTCLSVHVDRHATESRPTYRPIVSTDTRSTDALSTHDPNILRITPGTQVCQQGQKDTLFKD